MLRKVSSAEQCKIIPDDEVHQAFLAREDIAGLEPTEQERRWAAHLARVDQFREWLAGVPVLVVEK